MVAPGIVSKSAFPAGEHPSRNAGRRSQRARSSTSAANQVRGDEDDDLAWHDMDHTAPLLEALDRMRTIEPDQPTESQAVKILRAKRAYRWVRTG